MNRRRKRKGEQERKRERKREEEVWGWQAWVRLGQTAAYHRTLKGGGDMTQVPPLEPSS